ncbi:MAG: tetratricopeptide repeat protein [Bifidobacterium pseudocatenulatum]
MLIGALKIAVLPIDCEVLYYRLGYALWQLGRLPEALACYAMMVNGGTPFRTAARDEAEEVSRQMGLPSPDMKYGDACDALRSGGAGCAGRQGVRYDSRRDLPDGCWFPATGSGCGLDAWNARWR